MIEVHVSDDLDACLKLRRVVFIEEQNVPEDEDIDGLDDQAMHLLATCEGQPAGTARLMINAETLKIGRVCVLGELRGRGIGKAVMQKAIALAQADPKLSRVYLSSQTHALAFYEDLGFVAYGPEYDDAGIPHRDMERPA